MKTSKKNILKKKVLRTSPLHIALDTYSGTKNALENFFLLVSNDGIIFDQYKKKE